MEGPKIYKAIHEAMEACQAVGKDSTNKYQNYKYRSIDALMNAINPAMRKAGIFSVPEVLDIKREERNTKNGGPQIYSVLTVKYSFFAEDGSSVTAVVIGEGMDAGDKSCNKAMSAAYKYALFHTFCIPTEEMVDSEKDSPEITDIKPQPRTTAPQTARSSRSGTSNQQNAQRASNGASEPQKRVYKPLTDEQKKELNDLASRKGKTMNFSVSFDFEYTKNELSKLPDKKPDELTDEPSDKETA